MPLAASTVALQNLLISINATNFADAADSELIFSAELPPLGYSIFEMRATPESVGCAAKQDKLSAALHENDAQAGNSKPKQSSSSLLEPLHMTNGIVTVEFDSVSGLMSGIAVDGGPRIKLSSSFSWYNSSDGLNSDEDRLQSSGAYIFRPNGAQKLGRVETAGKRSWRALLGSTDDIRQEQRVQLEIRQGDEVSEARQVFENWATLITRIYKGQRHVEVEWTVGPIPFEDGYGREVVLQYESDLDSGHDFWTDANGRAMVRRRLNYRPSWDLNVTEGIAGNYYPVTAAAFIKDDKKQFAVLTDRAQGAASLSPGVLELMVHRRSLVDDRRGVGEALNETACGCTQCECPGEFGCFLQRHNL